MRSEQTNPVSVKEQLILAGLREIESRGLTDLSLRRIASSCGLSCAAPYKHFADKHDFILAIIDYVNQEWLQRSYQVEKKFAGDSRRQLVELSMEYIYFLLENPHFRSILMLRDDSLDEEQTRRKTEVSATTKRIISRYCAEAGLSKEAEIRKTFVVRSLVYGASLMLDNGQLPKEESSFRFIAETIDREFELP
ncbi:MAG: TetR/AcrR family transcriptional regulator [Bacillota bacterium]|nr:TetR/AcrR family transcriptional regulator [Bacillota bacterium]